MRQVLQSVTKVYYKVLKIKVRQVLESVADCYYKVHQVLQSTYNYYKVRHHTVWQRKKRKIFRWCDFKRSYTLRVNIVFVWLCLNLCQLEWLKKSVKSMSMSSHKVKFLNFLNDSAWCCWKSSLFHSGVCWMNERKLNEFVLK